jgi:hypothetical protein
MMDMFQKFVKCAQFFRKSVLPPKIIHASDFVNATINPCRALWGITLHNFCNVMTLKAVKSVFDMLLIGRLNQCKKILLNGQG